jgi:hypothetical protein
MLTLLLVKCAAKQNIVLGSDGSLTGLSLYKKNLFVRV